jgi:hypothetical protein
VRQETFDRLPPEIQTRLTVLLKRLSMRAAGNCPAANPGQKTRSERLPVAASANTEKLSANCPPAIVLTPQEIFEACAARRDQERAEIAKYQRESL